jgi:hypothetical protein
MEVVARLEFTTPCLGNVRKPDYDRMLRDRDDQVIFMPSWWRAAFAKASTALSRYHRLVDKIHPALQVEGRVTQIKRFFGRQMDGCKTHEGFDTGAVVTFRFILPYGMTIGQFTELLEAVGDYIGISPYGWKTGDYGHFKVQEVARRARGSHQKSRASHSGDSG